MFPDTALTDLSLKAAKQKILLSPEDISSIVKSLSKLPFILSVTFHKVLTNSLCTTNRIKNFPTCSCFACGHLYPWYKDDLFHFLRCPHVAFIFGLPKAFGSLKRNYFSPVNLAKIAVFFEVYYLLTRQYGINIVPSSFEFIASKASSLARHVAMKNKIQYLTKSSCISNAQVQQFVHSCNICHTHMFGCLDIVEV